MKQVTVYLLQDCTGWTVGAFSSATKRQQYLEAMQAAGETRFNTREMVEIEIDRPRWAIPGNTKGAE